MEMQALFVYEKRAGHQLKLALFPTIIYHVEQ